MTIFTGLYSRPQVTRYVILFIGRDGSTYLSGLLASHPNIEQFGERFGAMRKNGKGTKEQLDWARNFFTPGWIGRTAAVGFKTKIRDVLDPDGFARLLTTKRCHIIEMRRRNRIKAVVSEFYAARLFKASGKWNLYKEADRQPSIAIDPDEFDVWLKEREAAEAQMESYVRQLGRPTLRIVYEDLLIDTDAVLRNIFDFLRVQPKELAGRTLKHTSDNLRDVIVNFDELRARYVGSEYEAMFDEVLIRSPIDRRMGS